MESIEKKVSEVEDQCISGKYLGFWLNDKMKMKDNINFTCKKVAKEIGFLGCISNKLNLANGLTLFEATITPYSDYLLCLNHILIQQRRVQEITKAAKSSFTCTTEMQQSDQPALH